MSTGSEKNIISDRRLLWICRIYNPSLFDFSRQNLNNVPLICNNFPLWILMGNEFATLCKKKFLQKCDWEKSYLSLDFWREKSNVLGVEVSMLITTFVLKKCFSLQITTLVSKKSYTQLFFQFFRAIVYLSFRLTNTTKVDWMPEATEKSRLFQLFILRKKSLLKTWDWQGKISVKASNKLFFAKIAKNCYYQQSSSILLLLLLEEKILPLRKIITLLLGKKKLILVQKHSM